jgi:shikimate kinase
MGAGKSAVGVRLAQELRWIFVDLDAEIVRMERKSIAEIFETAGETAFRKLEHFALSNILQRSGMVLALGGGAMESAVNRQALANHPETLLVYLEAPFDVLVQRCEEQQREQPGTPRRPVLEHRGELAARFLRRRPWYESAHTTIATADCGLDEVVLRIVEQWKRSTQKDAVQR